MKTRMKKTIQRRPLSAACVFFAACVGAETQAFSPRFPDNQLAPTQLVATATAVPSAGASGNPVVIGTAETGAAGETRRRFLVAFDAATGTVKWEHELDAVTRPDILGDVVVVSDRTHVAAYDQNSGTLLWRRELSSHAYVGAAREGDVIVTVANRGAQGGRTRTSRVAAVDARSGAELWAHNVSVVVARPAVDAGYVFLPWDNQNISVLGLADGVEVTRLRSTDDTLTWVENVGGHIFYGGRRGFYRFDARSVSGTRTGSTYGAPGVSDAPRDPAAHEDGFLPLPGTRSARGKIRLVIGIDSSRDGIAFSGDAEYLIFYRYVFSFGPNAELRWARMLDQDVLNARAGAAGLLVVGERGAMTLLDTATGATRAQVSLGRDLVSAALPADWLPPLADATETPTTLRESLMRIALDNDARLVAGRAYAVARLSTMPEPEITRDLLDLAAQRSTPKVVREAIGVALQNRPAGHEFLIQGLRTHYDFIENTAAPPLDLLVPAITRHGLRDAVPALVDHLFDHETPAAVLPELVSAIVQLGEAATVPALRAWVTRYRGDSTFSAPPEQTSEPTEPTGTNPEAVAIRIAMARAREQRANQVRAVEALARALDGIFRLGADEGRQVLTTLASDPRTSASAAAHIRGLFEEEQRTAEADARREAEAQARAAREAAQRAEAELPLQLAQRDVNEAFAVHTDTIRTCVSDELTRNPRLAQVRLLFIVNADGSAREHTYAPNNEAFVSCLKDTVESIRFPRSRRPRQRAAFTISVQGNAQRDVTAEVAIPSDAPWWVRIAGPVALAAPAAPATQMPWWQRRRARSVAPQFVAPPQPPGPGPGNNAGGRENPWWSGNGPRPSNSPSGTPNPVNPNGTPPTPTPPSNGSGPTPTPPVATPPAQNPWWMPSQ